MKTNLAKFSTSWQCTYADVLCIVFLYRYVCIHTCIYTQCTYVSTVHTFQSLVASLKSHRHSLYCTCRCIWSSPRQRTTFGERHSVHVDKSQWSPSRPLVQVGDWAKSRWSMEIEVEQLHYNKTCCIIVLYRQYF